MMTDREGLILLLVLFHLFQYYDTKLTFFFSFFFLEQYKSRINPIQL